MPKHVRNVLTVKGIERVLRKPGRYHDGAGLFLNIPPGGFGGSWLLRFSLNGRRRWIGLGAFHPDDEKKGLTLAGARKKADEIRYLVREGGDPFAARDRTCPTFAEAARAVHETQIVPTSRNGKAAAQWLATLETYVFPRLGETRLDRVTSTDVVGCLSPIWRTKAETARRVRQRVRTVMEWGRGLGHVTGDCVVAKASLALDGPRKAREAKPVHHAAMAFADVPGFLSGLLAQDGRGAVTRLALAFTTLTAARSGEVRGATWSEIDLAGALWTVPEGRMKAGKEHRVPLSPQALHVLDRARALVGNAEGLVFPGTKGQPLSDMTLLAIFRRAGIEATPHGMRSAFRDWAAEETAFPREIAELCLAHNVGNAVERAYRRSDLLEKRRALMAAWGAYCLPGMGDGAAKAEAAE